MYLQKQSEISAWTIAAALAETRVDVEVETEFAGQRIDALVTTPQGSNIVVLLKQWPAATELMVQKANREAEHLINIDGISASFILIPDLPDEQQTDRVRNLRGLLSIVQHFVANEPDFGFRVAGGRGKKRTAKKSRRVFVAMPFAVAFEDLYYVGILPAVRDVSGECIRIDQEYFSQSIIQKIQSEIGTAEVVIADVTDANPNVIYEVGYAHGLKKNTIHLSATPPQQLPFDIQQWPTLLYNPGQTHRLTDNLRTTLSQLLGTTSN
jgi:hypothetical protein